MKKIYLGAILVFLGYISLMAQPKFSGTSAGEDQLSFNKNYSKAHALDSIMRHFTRQGIPGAALAVYSEEGWWQNAAGFANTEKKKPLSDSNLHYLQSVSKSYMAAAIMKMKEQGKINLDAPITKYLPSKYSKYIRGASGITVRMLLNHTSGVPEYSDQPAFISWVLQHPLEKFSTLFVLQCISGKDLLFPPGTKHVYVNTNYELLALIGDAITGDHATYITKYIFEPLGLRNTFYWKSPNYLHYKELVDSYWDVLNTGKPANITGIQKTNVASFIGDDGIVCSSTDAVKFLKGLMEGKLLSVASIAEMESWVNGEDGKPIYGLGLVHYEAAGIEGFGHSGGGIGGGCLLIYIPSKKVYAFMSVNIGTLFGGELAKKADEMKDAILATLIF